jgi:DNA-binding CsgD family transcriptional regulator
VLSEAALDQLPSAIFVVDAMGRPLLMNRQAQALLARQDVLALTRIGLRPRHGGREQALRGAIAEACQGRGGALSLPRPGGPALRLLVSPLEARGEIHALLIVDDPAATDPAQEENLRGYYGLSAAEAETAVALARGMTPQDVAASRGVSLNTIRTQIRHALRKTEGRGIPELVALVASAPRRAP